VPERGEVAGDCRRSLRCQHPFPLRAPALPWYAWAAIGWRLAPLVAGALVLRRLPWMFALSRSCGRRPDGVREVAFVGWFGPIGVSALFYATCSSAMAVEERLAGGCRGRHGERARLRGDRRPAHQGGWVCHEVPAREEE
jgi:hypothetical protein